MKIRVGFVSNSSSSSFVVIDSSGNYDSYSCTGQELTEGFDGRTEFGWDGGFVGGVPTRINFAYLQTVYDKSHPEWLEMLNEVLKEELGLENINYNINTDFATDRWGYIDHQSCSGEGSNTEIFESKKHLKDFIFGKGSRIFLDNDNH